MLLSPNPFSLLFAVLLCLPLAIVFTTGPTADLHHPPPLSRSPAFPPQQIIPPPPEPTSQFPPKPPQIVPTSQPTVLPPPTPPPPPELPPDDDQDIELFRRASRSHAPAGAPRKIAFMFLTTTPLPFAPLWERFFNGNRHLYNVYIHADPTHDYSPPFSGVFSGRVIPYSKPTRRHSPTLVTAARRLLSHALLDDRANHAFALLSASCIPLHSFHFTYNHLTRSKKSFIEILGNETGAYDRWAARGEEAMLPEVPFEGFKIGSQFWVLTRRHARKVVRDTRMWRKFRLPCVRLDTCYPEENYFPTLVSTVGARGVVPAALTHVDWSGSFDGHPRVYNESEVGEDLIRLLRTERLRYGDFGVGSNGSDSAVTVAGGDVPFLFARKFAPDCAGPLLDISDDVIFRD